MDPSLDWLGTSGTQSLPPSLDWLGSSAATDVTAPVDDPSNTYTSQSDPNYLGNGVYATPSNLDTSILTNPATTTDTSTNWGSLFSGIGNLFSGLGNAASGALGVNNAINPATQPSLLQNLGLADASTGALTSTGTMILFGGAALLLFTVMKS